MTVSLLRPYGTTPAGTVITLPDSTETALVAQGLATSVAASTTSTGAQTIAAMRGKSAIAAGASSVVITNALVTAGSSAFAVISQSAADATCTQILRVSVAAGALTITGNANATAATLVDWVVFNTPPLASV